MNIDYWRRLYQIVLSAFALGYLCSIYGTNIVLLIMFAPMLLAFLGWIVCKAYSSFFEKKITQATYITLLVAVWAIIGFAMFLFGMENSLIIVILLAAYSISVFSLTRNALFSNIGKKQQI